MIRLGGHKAIESLNTGAGKVVEEETATDGVEMTRPRSQRNHHHPLPFVI